ncbi:hypothetical protein JCM8547_006168 [Rhodosporidiobolus lusitaniae]
MFAARSTLRQTLSPLLRRHASTVPRSYTPPQYTFKQRLEKFTPVEAYPLIALCIGMSSFGTIWGLKALFASVPGELRMAHSRLGEKEDVKPWEDERALAGKW